MKTYKILLPLITLLVVFNSCTVNRINEKASNDNALAKLAIEQIREQGLVVIFPTEYKKERALRNMVKSRPSLQSDIKEIQDKRKERYAIWKSEMNNYKFSDVNIVPDSLLKKYIEDPSKFSSYDENGNQKKSEFGDIYALYTDYGGFEIKRDGEFIPNPFPNWKRPSKWAAIRDFVGVQGDEKSINSFFTELDKSFFQYYSFLSNGNLLE